MTIPATRQRVHIEGHSGLFLVLWVDHESETAQVVPVIAGDEVLSVPFAHVHLPGTPSDAGAETA